MDAMEHLMESYSSDCDVSEKSDNNHHTVDISNHSITTSNQDDDDDKGQKERLEEGSRKRSSDSNDNSSVHSKDTKSSNQSSNTRNSSSNSSSSTSRDQRQQRDNIVKKSPFNMKEFISWCEYIPMRLTTSERLQLVVLENALEVCEYTDVVDVTFSHTRKNKYTRILESLIDTLSISCGLITSNNLVKGEALLRKTLNQNVPIFMDLFEVGRRFKIMNPSKMRNTYGKLMYLLMDAESHLMKSELRIDFVKPILTVALFLKQRDAGDMIHDELLAKSIFYKNIEKKESAKKELLEKYTSDVLSADDIQRALDSIGDNEAYKAFNVNPVETILRVLEESFDPIRPPKDEVFSLELNSRNNPAKKILNSFSYGFSGRYFGRGACLSHDHKTQFLFVKQSLLLWREIMFYMPKLWMLADLDMLNEPYRLADTGQGYQRLQSCPRVGAEMRRILSSVQSRTSSWVGLSVVHLGDRDVPNALIFIDKYTQVPRILKPIAQCIVNLPDLVEDTAFHEYVSAEWGSINGLRMQILSDFFKHGFDGSGDDGGSCIDGRLTSAWNWCSKLHKKPYYHVFMFTGFQGFDGDWKEE